MNTSISSLANRKNQRGATLLIALVFLLILTTLAITNMREVALESRITGNLIDQKQLFNASEAGLKDGEYRTIGTLVKIPGKYSFEAALRPVNATSSCGTKFEDICVLNQAPQYTQSFDENDPVKAYAPDDVTDFNEDISWYAIPTPGGAAQGENENPEYGNMAMGIGIFRYEINSRASSDYGEVRLRSTVARVYN
ncbi:PilX N-terminal domain-containing pilus assembly protein [Pseudomonas sp. OIL-1]|uniref:pilus assembly PilX family protein n=1 Tax=Pseudomonas sp. OIL-1 TaxID=2706126 RepID=UPI0013A799A8|nr:PilX N-terminal domain-containing pilus assembly protein [Pseudomonas sp. OIL-1]QIB49636.1 pilus assembly protein PilX [Pseudomonas sp. OIL-1]